MRTADVVRIAVVSVGVGLMVPAFGFDGQRTDENAPVQALAAPGIQAAVVQPPEAAKGLVALEYAAEQGHTIAQWKLGRMYSRGDGVPQNDLRAFRYFSSIANAHADDSPFTPESRLVSSAFVALGNYYSDGIANSDIKADPSRAREMYRYAATYFADPEAQYFLGRIYYLGSGGVQKDAKQAARWLGLAANKGQHEAQALLGMIFFNGEEVPRQAARGLMWLMIASDGAGSDDSWIKKNYHTALTRANADERQMALMYLENYLKNRRD